MTTPPPTLPPPCPMCTTVHPQTEPYVLYCLLVQAARAAWPKEPKAHA